MNKRRLSFTSYLNFSWALFACLFFSGCATIDGRRGPPVGQRGFLGIKLQIVNNQILITGINPGSAAEKAGLQPNDFLIGYNGRKLESLEERQVFWREVKAFPGKIIDLSIERRGQQIPIKLTIGKRDIFADEQVPNKLEEELLTKKKVALVVIVTQINYIGSQDNEIIQEKAKVAAKTSLEAEVEKFFLDSFGLKENFVMIERSKLDEIFKELHFHGSGAISPEFVKDVGRMTGASHIVFVDWSRYKYEVVDVINMRLIDVESGTILAVDVLRKRFNY